jgi:peptidase E
MTKYILIGVYPTKTDDGGKAFVDELIEGFDQPVRILICLFARPEETWEEVFEKDKAFFASMIRDRKFFLQLAQPGTLKEQVRNADVIYFRGGRTKQLMKRLQEYPGWEEELEGKTVAGTSAGVNFLANYYYSLDDLEICEGLGILPVKALVHYGSDYNAPNIDWEKATSELRAYGEKDMEVLKLAEGEFVVREI